jgi:chemotaxis protein CheD
MSSEHLFTVTPMWQLKNAFIFEFIPVFGVQADPTHMMLQPGEIVVTRERNILVTTVRSGVAVCLWDPETRIGGMSHFIWPWVNDAQKATARFGNVATVTLIKMMQRRAPTAKLEAHIFGGAAVIGEVQHGMENLYVARKVLYCKGIPVKSDNTGGIISRKVIFNCDTGEVSVRKTDVINCKEM